MWVYTITLIRTRLSQTGKRGVNSTYIETSIDFGRVPNRKSHGFKFIKGRKALNDHARTSRICRRHSVVVLYVLRTEHNIRLSRVEWFDASTGRIVMISKCCCASAPSPYKRRGTRVDRSCSLRLVFFRLKSKTFFPRTKSTYTWKQPQQTRDQNYHQPSFQIRVTQGFKQVHVLTPIPFNASRFASEQRVVYLGEVIKRWDNVMWEHHGLFAIHLIIKKPLLVSHLNLEGTAGKPANNMSLKHNLNPATPRLRPHSTVWVQMVQNVAK